MFSLFQATHATHALRSPLLRAGLALLLGLGSGASLLSVHRQLQASS